MYNFPKNTRLTNKKSINNLFKNGNRLSEVPFLVFWNYNHLHDEKIKVLITVSKKTFKLAVDRNLIKRRIRESFRTQQNELVTILSQQNKSINVAILYNDPILLKFNNVEKKIKLTLNRLINQL